MNFSAESMPSRAEPSSLIRQMADPILISVPAGWGVAAKAVLKGKPNKGAVMTNMAATALKKMFFTSLMIQLV